MLTILASFATYSEEAKKEEPKKEEVKKEEPKKADVIKAPVVIKPKECFYTAHVLAIVDSKKFDDEVKKIQEKFEKCEQNLLKMKEIEARLKDCRTLNVQVKEKRNSVLKLASESTKLNKKEDFEQLVNNLKAMKEELAGYEAKYREHCPVNAKIIPKKEESKKEEPKKEEPKKEEAKPEEPKKEEAKK